MLKVSKVLMHASFRVSETICLEKCEAARMNLHIQVNRTRFIMDRIDHAICSSVASQVPTPEGLDETFNFTGFQSIGSTLLPSCAHALFRAVGACA
jgi:hypothetical protein